MWPRSLIGLAILSITEIRLPDYQISTSSTPTIYQTKTIEGRKDGFLLHAAVSVTADSDMSDKKT